MLICSLTVDKSQLTNFNVAVFCLQLLTVACLGLNHSCCLLQWGNTAVCRPQGMRNLKINISSTSKYSDTGKKSEVFIHEWWKLITRENERGTWATTFTWDTLTLLFLKKMSTLFTPRENYDPTLALLYYLTKLESTQHGVLLYQHDYSLAVWGRFLKIFPHTHVLCKIIHNGI